MAIELAPRRDIRILDLGCGSGAFLLRLKDLGFTQLWGVDIEPPKIGLTGISLSSIDIDTGRIPHADAAFDLIFAIEVIEHVENLGLVLRELNRLLAKGGQVVLTTPNVHSAEAKLRFLLLDRLKQFDEIGDPTHITPIFQYPFEKMLRRHSLTIQRRWGFPLDGSSVTSRPLLRSIAFLTRLLARSATQGDNLFMILERSDVPSMVGPDKRLTLTAHY